MDGIDISHHQKVINLSKVEADFIICKATEGKGYTDPMFETFAKKIKDKGALRGFYHFARADLNNTGKEEADWFLSVVKPHLDNETILILDWEAGSIRYGVAWAKAFLDRVRKVTGMTPLLYTSSSVTKGYDWSTVARRYPLWCANYGSNPIRERYTKVTPPSVKYWKSVSIHQYGSRGRLAGYPEDLDINRSYIDKKTWFEWASKTVEDEQQEVESVGMVSPAEGRYTSSYGRRKPIPGVTKGSFHAGVDIANDIGTNVYAAYDGRVKDEGSDVAPYRSGTRNLLIENPDGEGQYYGHLDSNLVNVGDYVKQGQHIGEMGARGNVTGPHLHFECWADADNPSSHRDPMIDFNHWGVKIGSKPVGIVTEKPKPKPKPSKPKKPVKVVKGPSGQGLADTRNIQEALKEMGYYKGRVDGKYGPMTKEAVRDYQRAQNKWGDAGLVVDGDWYTTTQAWFEWVEQLQRVLPAWRGVPDLIVDGDYGSRTHNAVKIMQGNNGLKKDGYAKRLTISYMKLHGSKISQRP